MLGKARISGVLFCGAIGLVGFVAMQACSSTGGGGDTDGGLNTDVPPPGTPGGPITVPVGTLCTDDAACGGGRCENGACLPGARCTDDTACAGTKCVDGGCVPASATDGVKNGDETDIDCGGLVAPRCAVGAGCAVGVDCKEAVCGPDGLCAAPTNSDTVKNGDETDVDCGGTSGNICAAGKTCNLAAECDSKFCTNNKCEPRQVGRQDGDETDVDCGGIVSPACAAGQMCLADADCQSQGCDATKHCALSPSCKVLHGGTTCGTGEFPDANKNHESCCKSLPVAGYNDAAQNGKTVYVDKYEITAGRMRAFVDATGGNVKAWIQAHPPTRWNNTWNNELPTAKHTSANINIDNSTLYPNDATYHLAANHPTQGTSWFVTAANYSSDVGLDIVLGEPTLFPEFFAQAPPWEEDHYSANHASNCYNEALSEGFSTYWFPKSEMNTVLLGSKGKYFTQEQMDEKSLSCATFAMMAAFCAWDGGQLMTAEVSDYITNNTVSPLYFSNGGNFIYQNGKLATKGNTTCAGDGSIVTYSDGATPCIKSGIPDAYDYPFDYARPELLAACSGKSLNQSCTAVTPPGAAGVTISGGCTDVGGGTLGCREKHDGSGRVAPPGRLVADVTLQDGAPAGTEPWMDMIGNLQEAVFKAGETQRFDYRGYGIAYGSIQHHKMQQTTPRYKGASFGARCMRFK